MSNEENNPPEAPSAAAPVVFIRSEDSVGIGEYSFNAENVIERVIQYGKLAGFVAVGVYATGIFITNAYLTRWGASDFSLVRPRAILAGLWFIVFLCLLIIPSHVLMSRVVKHFTKSVPNDGSIRSVFLGLAMLPIGILVLFVSAIPMILIFIVFVNERPLPADGGFFLQFAGVMVTLQLMGYLVGGMLLGFNNPEKEQKDTRIPFALIGAIFILAFAYIFSGGIYEEIPEGLGGGGLRFEQLSFAKDLDADTITTIQQKFECRQDEKEGVRVGILFADDSYLLIVSRDQSRVLRLDRRYISSELWKHHTISGDTDCDSPK